MKNLSLAILLTPFAFFTLAHSAQAQSQSAEPPSAAASAPAKEVIKQLDRVEVTASKRKQLAIDVPYAVTAIGAGEIRDRGVVDIQEMQSAVPSLFITENGPGQSRIQLRGMSTLAGLPTVGEYLDEMSINMDVVQRALDIPLVDMAGIEVLRGPQGTLYGDGSLGGTIKFITRNPRLDATEFSLETGARSVKNGQTGYFGNAVANLPLVAGTSGIRIVAGYEKMPGWVDNSVTGAKDVNGGDRQYIRGKGLVKITPDVDATLTLYHYDLKQDNPTVSRADYTVPFFIDSPNKDQFDLINLLVNADVGFATLTSSTGFVDRRLDQRADVTEYFAPLLPKTLLPAGAGLDLRQAQKYKIWTQELRLVSKDTGPLNWTTGLYVRDSNTQQVRTTPTTAPNPIKILDQQGTSPTDSHQAAVFGEVSYALTKAVVVTGGLRYFQDQQTLHSSSATSNIDLSGKFHSTSPRLNVLWKYASDASAYVNIAKGFRSGGFNAGQPPSYGPESVWTYELGTKGSTLGGKLQYDAAVYYTKYDDVQGLDVLPGSVFTTTINTGKASGPGFDLALVAELVENLSLDVAFGYVDLSYDVDTADRHKGDPLNYIPKKTLGVGLTYRYRWPVINMPGMARADYQHADTAPVIARSANLNTQTDAANYLNLRFGIEQPRWQAYLEGRNLTNFNGVTNPGFGVLVEPTRPTPRTLGVTFRTQF